MLKRILKRIKNIWNNVFKEADERFEKLMPEEKVNWFSRFYNNWF